MAGEILEKVKRDMDTEKKRYYKSVELVMENVTTICNKLDVVRSRAKELSLI
jgi:hypothetical protein